MLTVRIHTAHACDRGHRNTLHAPLDSLMTALPANADFRVRHRVQRDTTQQNDLLMLRHPFMNNGHAGVIKAAEADIATPRRAEICLPPPRPFRLFHRQGNTQPPLAVGLCGA
jgi:hypothetical protein